MTVSNSYNILVFKLSKTLFLDFIDAGSSDSEDLESVADVDTCTENELTKMFPNKFHIASEESVSLQKSYVLHMSASR